MKAEGLVVARCGVAEVQPAWLCARERRSARGDRQDEDALCVWMLALAMFAAPRPPYRRTARRRPAAPVAVALSAEPQRFETRTQYWRPAMGGVFGATGVVVMPLGPSNQS